MSRSKKQQPMRQLDLWGKPIEAARPETPTGVMTLDFETNPVRMVTIKGETWWVLSDVARILHYRDAEKASRLLREKQKGTLQSGTAGIQAGMAVVSEAGLYRLMMRSNKPEAQRFQDWVTDEVLPAIRKTGTYAVPRRVSDRVLTTARRLGCDTGTAKARVEQIDENKRMHGRMAKHRAKPRHFRDNHNGVYRGQCNGMEARDLRAALRHGGTPLDRFASVPLIMNSHIKALAGKFIEERKIPLEEQPAIYEMFAHEMTASDLKRLGDGYMLGITEHPNRGRIVDVFRPQSALTA